MNITFITGNAAKAEQLARHLDHPVAHKKIDLPEIQSLDLEEIIEHKAKEAYKIVRSPVIVDDVSFSFSALGKLPGPFIRWFIDEIKIGDICKLLSNFDDRRALGEICIGFYDGKMLKIFKADVSGSIAKTPKGKGGCGWDPIFIPDGFEKTWAEMDDIERNKTYIRPKALKKLEKFLKEEYLKR